MRARGIGIHIGGGSLPILGSEVHGLLDFGNALDDNACEVFDENTAAWVLLKI